MKATTGRSPAVFVTTQVSFDGSREKVMRTASVEPADSKRNDKNGTIVIGCDKNSGMWQDPGRKVYGEHVFKLNT